MTVYRSDLSKLPVKDGNEYVVGYSRYEGRVRPDYREVRDVSHAASVFANRHARKVFGKRGYCHHARMDLRTENGRWFSYEAFVGVPAYGGGTNGHNIHFTVTVEGEDK